MRNKKQEELVKPRKKVKRSVKDKLRYAKLQLLMLCLMALAALAAIVATVVVMGNTNLTTVTKTLSIPGLPQALEGYTIVQLTDLNGVRFGDRQERLAKAVKAIDYDAICMTGDMIGESGDPQPLYDLLDALGTGAPVLYVTGDDDPPALTDAPGADGSPYSDYMRQLQARGVTFLDAPVRLNVGGTGVWFSSAMHLNIDTQAALDALTARYNRMAAETPDDAAALALAAYRVDCAQRLDKAAQEMQSSDLHISLSHVPLSDEFVRSLQYAEGEMTADADSDDAGNHLRLVDVALCGHYVGGQWRWPVGGAAMYVPEGILTDAAQLAGLRRSNSVYVYTSAGLGCSSIYWYPSFRLFNPPEITVIRLTSQLGVK